MTHEPTVNIDDNTKKDRRRVAKILLARYEFPKGALHDYEDGNFARKFEWTEQGPNALRTEVAPDGEEGTGCIFLVTFLQGTALALESSATVDGAEVGHPADPDSDVTLDEMHEGNDDHIETLRDRARELRIALKWSLQQNRQLRAESSDVNTL